jgi:hypothetical protein
MMLSALFLSKQEHESRSYEYGNDASGDLFLNWETIIFS